MFIQTIRKEGLMYHGVIVCWFNSEEFLFIPQGKRPGDAWWCKTDYWEVIEQPMPTGKLITI